MTGAPLILVTVADDLTRSQLSGDLSRRFVGDYRVVSVGHDDATGELDRLAHRAEPVAAVIAEPVSSTLAGLEYLAVVRDRHPGARRILLVERGGWRHHPVRQAMVLGQVDGYLFNPWFPREQWLYLPMTEYLADYDRTRVPERVAFTVIGTQWDSRSHQLRDILARASIPFEFLPHDSAEGRAVLLRVGLDGSRLPVLRSHTGTVLVDPTDLELIDELGFPSDAEGVDCDVTIVGAGPSGMSAAVYAASEGLRTTIVDPSVPGGQAGTSSMIRNYLGFARGVSGAELTNRAVEQAWLFGAEFFLAQRAVRLEAEGTDRHITLAGGARITARAVVLATGVAWRRLGVPALEALVGAGVFYGAAGSEAAALVGMDVLVVGGGNSAGQAAVHLAKWAAQVTIVIRRASLASTMSDYLIREVASTPNIRITSESEVIDGGGSGHLQWVALRARSTGSRTTVPAAALFVMIGAEPPTEWLSGTVERDDRGYLLTGADVPAGRWSMSRPPLYLETSMPGVFAVGDVTHGASRRVAPSVGSGAVAVQLIHGYLDGLPERERATRNRPIPPN
jgi:thioredoxin reductase (NADPH)